ncbi:MAG: type I DNA topoisomerase [Candidatus Scalindua rubra]|uniref:DNA topoisomerase 1 n=1 Tax=Candidatus Scalindua brodae TaxID=237368 RepID=A0A0B0EM62_9BACT|nr:MAG: DNA topoisomerase I [Candidatus Scalindua brodae]MBZ0108235.1 type I DNA topoisomerase [Candidatus Scalindua rubra]TWU33499.1 DNA topoisomerase 1 [Candidatus Brocadiaceae bacterium S225]
MEKNLVIVESPAKAKTIEGYLGKGFSVKSCFGHVRDLPKTNKAIDIKNGFQPTYEIPKEKKDVIKELKKSAKKAEVVWLATDDDREGEAISWHLQEALNLDEKNTRRIVFGEITKQAILNAIESPRTIDIDLVNAQQARRILDRLVGFELSPILWKKIQRGLSAGRVQSVAVRMVVEREREIEQFETQSFFKVSAEFLVEGNKVLKAELSERFSTEKEALEFLTKCIGATFSIDNLEKKPGQKKPSAPFTTSTLQQEASLKLGFSVAQTMTLAQRLYESGKITYMRTDSVSLSQLALDNAAKEIISAYGAEYSETRQYTTKSSSAQEAHEAIRPTEFSEKSAGADRNQTRLYELIWKRSIASQMANARIERTTATIGISTVPQTMKATGEVITFEGFLKVYLESTAEERDEKEEEESKGILPPITVGQELNLDKMIAVQRFTRSPARFTEASLVKKLEELGIGRPSTYAPTISTIQKRGYVLKEHRDGRERQYQEMILANNEVNSFTRTEITGAEKAKLFPTDVARIVNDFLVKHFSRVTDYSFTASIEKEFDDIATGKLEWDKMIGAFYGSFHEKVEATEAIDRSEVDTSRELGKDPKTGRTLLVRLGPYGPMAQIGTAEELEEEEKPKYASLLKGQLLESITFEEAINLFKLPREVGTYEDKVITAAIGRFGPYIRHDSKFVSLTGDDDPYTVEQERAIELIEAKRKADAEKFIKSFDENPEVQVLNGRYGPYIKVGKKNVKIPKDQEPKDLTLKECLDLAEKAPEKKARGGKRKPKTATKKKK